MEIVGNRRVLRKQKKDILMLHLNVPRHGRVVWENSEKIEKLFNLHKTYKGNKPLFAWKNYTK